ncbi:unnamed protein product [Strongylus vulgaris]|uniref:Uncharacterized protein n=1 Tax=Strongylus vulgaris TaxID=40348 RepID=A0A3P7JHC2_STRVU|nr:unnamed protein product [Strongylus vulgaris]
MDHIYGVGCHQNQCQIAQDAMDSGPNGHVKTLWRLSHALHLQRKTVSTNADVRVLVEAAGLQLLCNRLAENKVQEDGREAAE